MRKINTIGDSHCHFAWKDISGIHCNYLGPITAFAFGRDCLDKIDVRLYDISEGDTLIFSLGEIDCRGHIRKHITQDRDYKQAIDDIVDGYVHSINVNKGFFKHLNVGIFNIPPPVRKEHVHNCQNFPFIGTNEERRDYAKYFNKKLSENCKKLGWIFIDVYNRYSDEQGFMLLEYSDYVTHINNPVFLEEYLKEKHIL